MSEKKNLIFYLIVIGIVLSSAIFVEWKSLDNEHYQEAYEIFTEIGQKEIKINKELGTYGGELTYFSWVRLHNVDEFPILMKEMRFLTKNIVSLEYYNPEIDNLRDYFQVLEKQKITHLLLDGINNAPEINDELRLHLIDIFNHENKYLFLVKEYDSRENGFNYHVKLFKINYDLYN